MTWGQGSSNASFTIPPMSLFSADIDSEVLRSVVEHVFLPPKLPQADAERGTNMALCHILIDAAEVSTRTSHPPRSPYGTVC